MKDHKLKDYTDLDFIKKEVNDSKKIYLKKIIGQLLMLQEDL